MTEIGARVGAILSADRDAVQFLGWGIYKGDLLIPDWERVARGYLPAQREAFFKQALKTQQYWVEWHTRLNTATRERNPSAARTEEQVQALAAASFQNAQDRLGWTDEQVIEDMKSTSLITNPCIELDTGAVVWGMECHWREVHEIESLLARFEAAGATVQTVTLPSKQTAPINKQRS